MRREFTISFPHIIVALILFGGALYACYQYSFDQGYDQHEEEQHQSARDSGYAEGAEEMERKTNEKWRNTLDEKEKEYENLIEAQKVYYLGIIQIKKSKIALQEQEIKEKKEIILELKKNGQDEEWFSITFLLMAITTATIGVIYGESLKYLLRNLFSLIGTYWVRPFPEFCVNVFRSGNYSLHLSPKIIKNCWSMIPKSLTGMVHFFSTFLTAI